MSNMQPEITVLIRSYNSEKTIETAIQSAIAQTLDASKYKILVVDDGSIDETLTIIKRYTQVELIASHHKGSLGALNLGLDNVHTPYVIYLDSDDWFESTILEFMYNVIENHPEVDFVISDYYEITGKSKKVISLKDNIFSTLAAGIMFSTSLFSIYGKYDETLVFPEYDLLIKMLSQTKHYYIPKPLYNYFRHSSSITADKSLVKKGRQQLFDKYGRHFPLREY